MRQILFAVSLFVLLAPLTHAASVDASLEAESMDVPVRMWCVDKYVDGANLGDALAKCRTHIIEDIVLCGTLNIC